MVRRSLALAALGLVAIAPAAAQPAPPDDAPPEDTPVAPAPPDDAAPAPTPPEPAPTPAAPRPDRSPDPNPLRGHPALTGAARAAMREACGARAPTCDPVALLGRLERAALHKALRARGLRLAANPDGRRIGRIDVTTLPVLGEEVGFLRFANVLHALSRPQVIARELVFGVGDRWDPDKVEESIRRLRDPLSTSLAVIVAVEPADGGADTVDVLVVTRDVWSLRTNYNGELQDGTFTFLQISLSENNFLGRRKLAAVAFRMDQATFTVGPLFVDKNAFGHHYDVRLSGGPLWNRDSFAIEGSQSAISVSRPLWSLASRWGAFLEWSHRDAIERRFLGAGVRTYDAPSTPDDDALPWAYRNRQWSLAASGVRAWGDTVKHRAKFGYDLSSERPRLLPDFPGSPAARADFIADVLPRSERSGRAWVGYEVFTPRYRDLDDVDSFDLPESQRFGPRLQATAGVAPRWLGSDNAFATVSLEGSYAAALGDDGALILGAGASARYDGGGFIDRAVVQSARLVAPRLGPLRLVSEARAQGYFRERSNRRFTVGGDSGLRGFPVGAFVGQRAAVWQTELRTRSVAIALGMRWGLVAFYDLAGAGDTVATVDLHHDAGLGVRSLTPQLSAEVFRVDLAVPLDGPGRGQPRLIVGYRQAF